MAAGEDQAQAVVGERLLLPARRILVPRLEPGESLEDRSLVRQRPLASQPVDRGVAGYPGDPGGRVRRDPVLRPAPERGRERLLNGVLGGIEVAENADQGRDRPPRLTPEQAIDDLQTLLRYETASALVCSSEPDAS